MKIFAQRLRSRRLEMGYTQQEMADHLMVDRTTYSRYENSSVSPSMESLCLIADRLMCSLDWLFGRE